MTVWKEEVESLDDFVKLVQKIVMKKKLYVIGNSILCEIRSLE